MYSIYHNVVHLKNLTIAFELADNLFSGLSKVVVINKLFITHTYIK